MSGKFEIEIRLPEHWRPVFDRLAEDQWLRVGGGGLKEAVLVRLGKSGDGRLVCTGLIFGADSAHEIPARRLREIRLGELVSDLARSPQRPIRGSKSIRAFYRALLEDVVHDRAIAATMRPASRKRRPGRRPYTREELIDFAKAFRRARRLSPRSPIQFLANERRESAATIHRKKNRARSLGLL